MKISNVFFYIIRSMKSIMLPTEKEITINAPWGQIAGLTWGDPSSPPVILCHGKMDVSSGFRPLVRALPKSFYYVSIDLPGNGKSDHFPPGRFTVPDYVPTIVTVKEHFQWDKFAYIGHSLGAVIGKYYNFAYPNHVTRMVELDPVPAHEVWNPENFAVWYHTFYGEYYKVDKYRKLTATAETAPKYTYEKALNLMINTRGLTREASEHVLERSLEPVGEGLYRFTYDQRLKEIPRLPFNSEYMKNLYTSTATPTFAILAQAIVNLGVYDAVPFVNDESMWPNRNYKVKTVKGGHDFHINSPESIADDISKFLLEDYVKSKL